MNRNSIIVICFVLLGVICFSYQYQQIFSFPTHIHAWSLTDRYAVSLGFINNGFDFFHPQTFVLNHQFPGEFRIPSNQTITPVDFPINEYVVAVAMFLFHIKSIAVYKAIVFCYSLIGLWFLYKACYLELKSEILSFFVLLFLLSSPVYMYYQVSTIPTITGISNVFIGLYYYFKYRLDGKQKLLMISVLFFTIATLSRTPFIIFLLSLCMVENLPGLFSKRINIRSFSYFFVSGVIIVGYYFYNSYLGNTYGSIYLNYIMPAENWDHAKEILNAVYHNWLFQYFTGYHYVTLLILVFIVILFFFKGRKNYSEKKENPLQLFILYSFLLCIIYAVIMLWQFQNHDYYFLDTFFIPVILLLILNLSKASVLLHKNRKTIFVFSLLFLLFVPFMFKSAFRIQTDRRSNTEDVTYIAVKEYAGADKFLEKNQIKSDARILVIGSPAPNLPFIFMNREGFVVMDPVMEKISESLSWNYNYVVVQKSNLEYVMSNYPDFEDKLLLLDSNGLINLYKKR